MVVLDAGKDVAQLFQVLENFHADFDVRLDLAIFFGRQRAVFLEHLVVDADLADVVQETRQIEVAPLGGGHSQLFAQPRRDARNPFGMARSVWVLGVDGRRQAADDAEEQALKSA